MRLIGLNSFNTYTEKKKDLQNPLKSKERIEEMGWKVYKLSFGEPVYFHQAKKVYFK